MTELATILLVEDDPMIRQMLREFLENENFLILDASHGKRAFEILDCHHADLILLDLNLGQTSALDFIPQIKTKTDSPLMIISGEKNEAKKIASLNQGADDFVEKPFTPEMLKARINAHLRRYKQHNGQTNHAKPKKVTPLHFHKWRIDYGKKQLFDEKDHSADLAAREFILLDFLIQNADRAVPRGELCQSIAEKNYIPSARALDVKIARIRKKLGDNASSPEIIQTIRGVGYMFNKDKIFG